MFRDINDCLDCIKFWDDVMTPEKIRNYLEDVEKVMVNSVEYDRGCNDYIKAVISCLLFIDEGRRK